MVAVANQPIQLCRLRNSFRAVRHTIREDVHPRTKIEKVVWKNKFEQYVVALTNRVNENLSGKQREEYLTQLANLQAYFNDVIENRQPNKSLIMETEICDSDFGITQISKAKPIEAATDRASVNLEDDDSSNCKLPITGAHVSEAKTQAADSPQEEDVCRRRLSHAASRPTEKLEKLDDEINDAFSDKSPPNKLDATLSVNRKFLKAGNTKALKEEIETELVTLAERMKEQAEVYNKVLQKDNKTLEETDKLQSNNLHNLEKHQKVAATMVPKGLLGLFKQLKQLSCDMILIAVAAVLFLITCNIILWT
eukprot:Filipodium_phascolosomae@DN3861_c0_g1_i1.p1